MKDSRDIKNNVLSHGQERKDAKKKARGLIKKHYLFVVLICLLSAFIGSEFYTSLNVVKSEDDSTLARGMEAVGEYYIEGESEEDITKKDSFGDRGVLASLVNNFATGDIYIKIVKAISSITNSDSISIICLIMMSLIFAILIAYFIQGLVPIVTRRAFLELRIYKSVPVGRITSFLKIKRWCHTAFTIFLMSIYQFLWCLTIVGAFIKHYSYLMVPYIIAENPDMKSRDVIKLSRMMMNGYKWEMFKLDLSFIGWDLLGIITLGLSEILYSNPYKVAAHSEYYVRLRGIAKENNMPLADKLNDKYLYEYAEDKVLKDKYSDVIKEEKKIKQGKMELHGFKAFVLKNFGVSLYKDDVKSKYDEINFSEIKIKSDKDALSKKTYPIRLSVNYFKEKKTSDINYLKSYSITTLILFFFTFAFVGWVWEVSLHLISDGTFVNRGVLLGPWLPIYGIGCVLILVVLNKFRKNPRLEFVFAILLCGFVEYFTSLYLELSHGIRWWDYSGYFLNLDGRICAEGLLVFGLGGLVVVYIVAPFFDRLFNKANRKVLTGIACILLCLFITDQIHASKHPNVGKGITDYSVCEVTEINI